MIAELTVLLTLGVHHILIGSTLILGLLLVARLTDLSPETKSWLWLSAFVLSIVLPFASLTSLNTRHTEVTTGVPQTIGDGAGNFANQQEFVAAVSTATSQPWHLSAEVAYYLSDFVLVVWTLWLTGMIWRIFQVSWAALRAHQLKAEAESCDIADFDCAPVLLSDKASSPMAIGFFHPVILLPKKFVSSFHTKQLKPILLHENAHIQRGDLWFGALQEFLALVFWWSPIIRMMNHRIHIYRELSCDIRAVRQLNSTKQYAQSLIDSARLMISKQENVLAMGLFSRRKDLNYRVTNVLQHTGKAPTKLLSIALGCVAMCITTGVAADYLVPDMDVSELTQEARHFSRMSQAESNLLITAVSQNDKELVEYLINRGTDINVPLIGDGTALMIAVKEANLDMIEALIALGADVNQSSKGDGNPLIVAAKENQLPAARLLINKGANVNAVVDGDESPLIKASGEGHFAMVEFLVENGADVNLGVMANKLRKPEWRSPLNKAANQQIREYLVTQGATE